MSMKTRIMPAAATAATTIMINQGSPAEFTSRWTGVVCADAVVMSPVEVITWYSPSGGVHVYVYFPDESVLTIASVIHWLFPASL